MAVPTRKQRIPPTPKKPEIFWPYGIDVYQRDPWRGQRPLSSSDGARTPEVWKSYSNYNDLLASRSIPHPNELNFESLLVKNDFKRAKYAIDEYNRKQNRSLYRQRKSRKKSRTKTKKRKSVKRNRRKRSI